jgi:hypothetical protein
LARYARIGFESSNLLTKYERNILIELCEEDLLEIARNIEQNAGSQDQSLNNEQFSKIFGD